jgi:exodeoxyribonuclease-3
LKIATWNINGVKARIDNLQAWLKESDPDIACLQEIKSVDEGFPRLELEALGYHVETHGQKGFNGVAILSKKSPDEVNRGLPGDDSDEQARFIEAVFSTDGGVLRVVSLYLPNGNPVDTEKFPYKLSWMKRLQAFAEDRLALEEPLVLAGDYNVIPEPVDCHDPKAWEGDALFRPESRNAFRQLENLGFTDALRAVNDEAETYTFWDYQAGAWPKNNGIRIDHLMLSPEAANLLKSATVEKHVRGWEKPSDHVPVAIRWQPDHRQPALTLIPARQVLPNWRNGRIIADETSSTFSGLPMNIGFLRRCLFCRVPGIGRPGLRVRWQRQAHQGRRRDLPADRLVNNAIWRAANAISTTPAGRRFPTAARFRKFHRCRCLRGWLDRLP